MENLIRESSLLDAALGNVAQFGWQEGLAQDDALRVSYIREVENYRYLSDFSAGEQ